MPGLLEKERIIAGPGFNRWLVPPAALAVHLSIGMAYGFSVFWLPLSRAVGVHQPIPCPVSMTLVERIFSTSCDWSVSMLGWTYTLFFIFLGGSAACFGPWAERVGPRKAGVVAAFCWGGGLMLSALAVYLHQIWLLWLGSGIIGGVGLGLGYISPVSMLIRWFPDRRGLATGLAIMGFGGGAMIGAPLADRLINTFETPDSVGVWQTFLVLGILYFAAMLLGAFGYRLPQPAPRTEGAAASASLSLSSVLRTRQFWLLWAVLCLNVSAGIGLLGMASPMLQEIFGGRMLGLDLAFSSLSAEQERRVATMGAAFTGLLSLFNIGGRLVWSSCSDYLGRKPTYTLFFLLGTGLFAAIPWAGETGNVFLFVVIIGLIMTMYGGGFATIPAYLADLFGPQQISAIHGRLLTAWSVAGILGPVVVTTLRDEQLARGVPVSEAYHDTMYLLAGFLVIGLICNLLVSPLQRLRQEMPAAPALAALHADTADGSMNQYFWVALTWSAVGIPLAWGVWQTMTKARLLFE